MPALVMSPGGLLSACRGPVLHKPKIFLGLIRFSIYMCTCFTVLSWVSRMRPPNMSLGLDNWTLDLGKLDNWTLDKLDMADSLDMSSTKATVLKLAYSFVCCLGLAINLLLLGAIIGEAKIFIDCKKYFKENTLFSNSSFCLKNLILLKLNSLQRPLKLGARLGGYYLFIGKILSKYDITTGSLKLTHC